MPRSQDAVRQVLIPQARSEALIGLTKELQRLLKTGKSRPEDRKLLAEISGLTAGENLAVNVSLATDTFFCARFR